MNRASRLLPALVVTGLALAGCAAGDDITRADPTLMQETPPSADPSAAITACDGLVQSMDLLRVKSAGPSNGELLVDLEHPRVELHEGGARTNGEPFWSVTYGPRDPAELPGVAKDELMGAGLACTFARGVAGTESVAALSAE